MHCAVVLAGGNIGDVEARFVEAERLLAERGVAIVARSRNYKTEAWGFESERLFTNVAWRVETELEAEGLLDVLQEVEALLGRNREAEQLKKKSEGVRYCSRTLDLDILFYDEEHISTERLKVPHPLIMERDFVIEPTCELLRCDRAQLGEKIEKIYAESIA
ncbi:MAG: 2-amino-4-hydroxy-6-hydroxymethyldihydropteridine diphosphokinase [Rikenellaceae bacterium]|nr:2-amino-4-hydroxy-6-hydroxymethyldihydropteridine diphosphokinase [Rikenellaceae bacterium]